VTPAELLTLLQDFYRETVELMQSYLANARSVGAYDANNAYQQVLGRQETHLQWISDATVDLGGPPPELPRQEVESASHNRSDINSLIEADARRQRAFLDRWSPRAALITNARHRRMLELILGEMVEHLRLFQQALEGRSDLLGPHADGKVLRGEVLPARPRN
jgi:hypothetical protein